MRRLSLIISVILLSMPAMADQKADLDALRQQIEQIQASLQSDENARDSTARELRETEKRIGQLGAKAHELERAARRAKHELNDIQQKQTRLAADKARQLDWLSKTARAGYMAGSQPGLKLLLNQEQPETVARLLRYKDYFQQARQQRVSAVQNDIQDLLVVAQEVEVAKAKLLQQQQKVAEQQGKLEAARQQRATTLATIDSRITNQHDLLTKLRQDEKQLEKLLRDIRPALTDIPASPQGEPFGKLRNKLPWPTARKIRAKFGSRREGPIRWNGVLLSTQSGTPVRVIHPGRVVYADWLRGYGLLTIVDHGDGFLTLYGNNQSLMRQVGEWVSLGEVLALAGDSGGNKESGLYFEIRQNGKPINPDKWCNSRVTLPTLALN